MAAEEGMNQEEVEVRSEGEADMAPEERAQTFADAVASKVELVKNGELSLEDFVEGCKAELDTVTPADSLGGLGDQGGPMDLGEAEA